MRKPKGWLLRKGGAKRAPCSKDPRLHKKPWGYSLGPRRRSGAPVGSSYFDQVDSHGAGTRTGLMIFGDPAGEGLQLRLERYDKDSDEVATHWRTWCWGLRPIRELDVAALDPLAPPGLAAR